MEAHRSRRTKDQARKAWYAHYRQVRFARWFGFIDGDANLDRLFLDLPTSACNKLDDACPFSEAQMNASC